MLMKFILTGSHRSTKQDATDSPTLPLYDHVINKIITQEQITHNALFLSMLGWLCLLAE